MLFYLVSIETVQNQKLNFLSHLIKCGFPTLIAMTTINKCLVYVSEI